MRITSGVAAKAIATLPIRSTVPHRWIYTGLAGLALGLMAGLCLAEDLVVGVARLPLSLPFYVAEAEGYFVAEGVKLRIEDCIVGRVCLKRLLAGEVSVATVADAPIVLSSFSSQAFFILATFSGSPNDTKLVARIGAGIAAPKDLVGKRIGTFTGTGAQYFLDSFLLFYGIDRRDVTIVSVPPDRAVAAIENREVDALAVFEPYASSVVAALGADGKTLPSSRVYRTTFNVVIDRRIAGLRDAELGKMLRALERANRFIHDQPLKAQGVLRARLQLKQNYIDLIWNDIEYELSLSQSFIALLESQARWATREGYATGAALPNYLNYIYPVPLILVLPTAVSIVK